LTNLAHNGDVKHVFLLTESGRRKEKYRLSAEPIKQTSVAPTNMISLYRGKNVFLYNGLRVFDQLQLWEA